MKPLRQSSGQACGIAMVGASWRTAPSAVRAALAAQCQASDEIAAAGYLEGSVCISTCSRTEWVVSAPNAAWAASLLKGALMTRLNEVSEAQLQVRVGPAAIHHLFRITLGLDSVAEGEAAVARQVLKAFEQSRREGTTDRGLKLLWKHLERTVSLRRQRVGSRTGTGIQSLVLEVVRQFAPGAVVDVVGRGEIGQSVARAIESVPGHQVRAWSRATMGDFMRRAQKSQAVVICTGAPNAWLELPSREGSPLCIDVGSPSQVLSAQGWKSVALDDLLSMPSLRLSEHEHLELEGLVSEACEAVEKVMAMPERGKALAAIDAQRSTFLNQELPALLEGLQPGQVRKVRRAVGAFAHALLRHAREPQP